MGIDTQIRLKKSNTKLFNNCDELMLWNYIQIISTKDLRYLVKSGRMPKKEILIAKIEEINKEFSELRGEQTMVSKNDAISYREELILQVNVVSALIERIYVRISLKLIASQTFDNLIKELAIWGFVLNKENPLSDELEAVNNELKAIQTTIDALTSEIYPETEENEVEEQNQVLNFYSLLITYQRILKIDKINPKKTSLLEFVAIEKQVKEAVKNNKKGE